MAVGVRVLKIVYLHQYFNTPRMSGSTRSYEAARRLVEWGHEVTLITTWREQHPDSNWFITNEDGIEVHWIPIEYSNEMGFYRRLVAFLRFAVMAAKKTSQSDADGVFASSTPLTISLPAIYAYFRKNIPYVLEVRDLWPDVPIAMGILTNPIMKWAAVLLEKISYKYAKRVVALSPGMAEGVESAGYPSDRIEVIPNGSDLALFDVPKEESSALSSVCRELVGRRFILYPGTVGHVNGVEYLVRLSKALIDSHADLAILVVGDGKENSHVRQVAQELGVDENNFFLREPVSKYELAKIMAESTAVVSVVIDVPALEANSANKFFDALAAGKPILVNHGGWQKELIEGHGVGLALSRDVRIAAGQLSDWIEDEADIRNAGVAARQLAEREFDRDMLSRDLEHVLREAYS